MRLGAVPDCGEQVITALLDGQLEIELAEAAVYLLDRHAGVGPDRDAVGQAEVEQVAEEPGPPGPRVGGGVGLVVVQQEFVRHVRVFQAPHRGVADLPHQGPEARRCGDRRPAGHGGDGGPHAPAFLRAPVADHDADDEVRRRPVSDQRGVVRAQQHDVLRGP